MASKAVTSKDIKVDQFDDRLSKVYSNPDNKLEQYEKWAQTYESDLVNDLGYVAHKDASEIFRNFVKDKSLQVLDVACGTGLVGEYLRGLGYQNIDGTDFCSEMLNIAQERSVYQRVWQQDFTVAAELEKLYDALICVGLFSFTVPEITHMHHVVNCVKPGGICIITVNGAAWEQLNLEPKVHLEAKQYGFEILEIAHAEYIRKEGIDSRVLVIRR